jgi:succinate dehydrogenase/fumarate reductase flavoprotein subunit
MRDGFELLYEADLAVIGGGSAGTLAAISAARKGVDVLLVESQNVLSGSRTVMGVDTFEVCIARVGVAPLRSLTIQ